MRQCPTCRKQYADNLRFCLEDGAILIDLPNQDREVETHYAGSGIPAGAHGSYPRKSRVSTGLLVLVGVLFLAAGIAIVAAGVGGYIYLSRQQNVDIPPTPSPRPTTTPIFETQTPSPGSTATPLNEKPSPDPPPVPPSAEPTREKPNVRPPDNDAAPEIAKDPDQRRPGIPKQISGGVLNGKAISLPKPPYPPAARAVKATGSVNVQVLVDEQGNVVSASAVSGHPLLRPAAVQAARSAKFSPTKLAGQPVKVSGMLVYNFVP